MQSTASPRPPRRILTGPLIVAALIFVFACAEGIAPEDVERQKEEFANSDVRESNEPPPDDSACEDVECDGGFRCDPYSGECVECLIDGDCNVGFFCHSETQSCVDESAPDGCTSDDHCDADQQCNLDTGECEDALECLSDTDCAGGQICDLQTNQCVAASGECTTNDDCPGGDVCTDDHHCVECVTNGDCVGGDVCTSNNLCVQCISSGDCPDNDVCTPDNYCVECIYNTDCPGGASCINNSCDGDDGGGGSTGCANNADCPVNGEVCVGGSCQPNPDTSQCLLNSDCPSGICNDAYNDCWCTGSADCSQGQGCCQNNVTGEQFCIQPELCQ